MTGRLAVLAVVVLALTGGTVAADRWPGGSGAPTGQQVVGAPATLPATGAAAVPVCPGPETLLIAAGGTQVAPPGPVVVGAVVAEHPQTLTLTAGVTSASGTVPVLPSGASPAPTTSTTAVAGSARALGQLGGTPVTAVSDGLGVLTLPRTIAGAVRLDTPHGGPLPALSSVQLSLGRSGDLRGLSAMGCPTAAAQSWLVGGGTQVGRRARLLLANPSATPAVVDVSVLGPGGPLPAPAGSGVLMPPGGQAVLLIDALAPGLDAVAVHVRARTGRVVATLNDTYVRGLTPGGVDDVTPAAPAARHQVVPGVSVAPAQGMTLPASADDPGAVAIRVVNPGSAEAVVRVHLLGSTGEVEVPGGVITIPPQTVRDVPVTQVPPGLYTAVVDADSDVVAGALVGRTEPGGQAAATPAGLRIAVPPSELAWAASAEPLSGAAVVALPAFPATAAKAVPMSATLSLADPGSVPGAVEVIQIGADGAGVGSSTLTVQAATSVELPLAPTATAILVRPVPGSAPLTAAVVLQRQDAAGPMVSVITVRSGATGRGASPTVIGDPRTGLGG